MPFELQNGTSSRLGITCLHITYSLSHSPALRFRLCTNYERDPIGNVRVAALNSSYQLTCRQFDMQSNTQNLLNTVLMDTFTGVRRREGPGGRDYWGS
jgi:hypothetical protein